MRRIFTPLLTALTTLSASAQFSEGFYRLQCKETGRYLTVHNDYVNKEAAKRTGQVELQSLETIEDFDQVVNDPGSVLYLKSTSQGWVIEGQNFTTEGHSFFLQFTEVDGAYRVWTTVTYDGAEYTRYLRDYEDDYGKSYITTDGSKSTNWHWYLKPVTDADKQYFGLKGDVKAGGKYYTAFFASFGIKLGSGMKAYAVNTMTKETTTLEDIGSTVPGFMPVVIECAGEKASDNKVTPLHDFNHYTGSNYLEGEYYCYIVTTPSGKERRDNPAWNALDYDPDDMRLLGESNDKLCFITATDVKYVPANRAYLYVMEGSAETLPTDGSTAVQLTFVVNKDDTKTMSVSDGKDASDNISIPEKVTQDGVEYKVTKIGEGAFQNNTGLTDVTIPASIISIGSSAFAGCKNLKSITVYNKTPISLSAIGTRGFTRTDSGSVFEGVDKETCILYVPEGSVDAYKAASEWKDFKNILPIGTTGIQGIVVSNGEPFDVFTISGVKVKSKTTSLDGLPRGIYIINGKKVIK